MHVYKLSHYTRYLGKLTWVQDVTFQTKNKLDKIQQDLEVDFEELKVLIAEHFGLDYDPLGGEEIKIGLIEKPFHEIDTTDLSKAKTKLHQELKETWA
jgi:hypothetical protein